MSANGQLGGDELTTVAHVSSVWSATVDQLTGGAIRAAHVTARAWQAMAAEAARAGLELEPIQPAGGYRSRAMQSDARAHPGRWNILPGIVQAPIGQSTHGLGNNIDAVGIASNTPLRRWLTANMGRFGFSYRDARNDPSCLHHDGRTAPASTTTTPIASEEEDQIMVIATCNQRGTWLIGPGYRHQITGTELAALQRMPRGYQVVPFENDTAGFDHFVAAHTQPAK